MSLHDRDDDWNLGDSIIYNKYYWIHELSDRVENLKRYGTEEAPLELPADFVATYDNRYSYDTIYVEGTVDEKIQGYLEVLRQLVATFPTRNNVALDLTNYPTIKIENKIKGVYLWK